MKFLRSLTYYRFLFRKTNDEIIFSSIQNPILVLTVAFNNVEFVELQIALLKKYFDEQFHHCILDNSTIPSVRERLKSVSSKNEVSYFSLPKSPFSDHKSHGAAMHWGFFHVVRRFRPQYFGYLDHDIFPFKEFKLIEKFHQGIYGRVVNSYIKGGGYLDERTEQVPYWSLWAGFSFFDLNRFKGLFPWEFNFSSQHFPGGYFLDTGGGLWKTIYSKTDYPGILSTFRKLKWNTHDDEGDQNDSFEILDEAWIHFVSLSNWRTIKDLEGKKAKLEEILYKARNQEGLNLQEIK